MKEFPLQAVSTFVFLCTMSIMLAAEVMLFLKSLGASISFRKTLNIQLPVWDQSSTDGLRTISKQHIYLNANCFQRHWNNILVFGILFRSYFCRFPIGISIIHVWNLQQSFDNTGYHLAFIHIKRPFHVLWYRRRVSFIEPPHKASVFLFDYFLNLFDADLF
jgi:hypothetical protein